MNKQTFISLLKALDESDWQAIVNGKALLIIDDLHLKVGSLHSENIILINSLGLDAAALCAESLSQADRLLQDYYRTHPLTPMSLN